MALASGAIVGAFLIPSSVVWPRPCHRADPTTKNRSSPPCLRHYSRTQRLCLSLSRKYPGRMGSIKGWKVTTST
ncbi:hypothetical protein EDB84DRAFT_1511580, partial [Lactarius hengduanensis]